MLSKGVHGSDLRIALLTEGEFFGETDLVSDKPSDVTVRTTTPCVLLTLSRKDLDAVLAENCEPRRRVQEGDRRASGTAFDGESLRRAEHRPGLRLCRERRDPETFVDYSAHPREYSLSAMQTVVRVHTRVSDLYNGPYDQLEEQMRLTVEGIKERQEWELVNNNKFGLTHSVDPAMRISTRYGAPTPDDLDELLALVWKKPAFFLAHPKAIAAFERECTWRGVPPVTMNCSASPVITWRGIPLVPCDKLEMKSRYQSNQWFGTTSILLMRVGEADQGVVGLHQAGIPGEISPSLSARLMGLDSLGVASYLLTLYSSCAVLTDDALASLENVEVGYYHDYNMREPQEFRRWLRNLDQAQFIADSQPLAEGPVNVRQFTAAQRNDVGREESGDDDEDVAEDDVDHAAVAAEPAAVGARRRRHVPRQPHQGRAEQGRADRSRRLDDGVASFPSEALRSVPLFSQAARADHRRRWPSRFKTEEVSLGNKLIVEGEDLSKFFIIAQGQVEVLSKGVHGSNLRIALLTEGEFFGETDLVSDKPSDVTVRTITPCVLLTLSRKDLDAVLAENAES